MTGDIERQRTPDEPIDVCFLNPAWLPEWFWLPAAKQLEMQGIHYTIPPIERGVTTTSVERNVEIIKETVGDSLHLLVVSSRSFEEAVRYIDDLGRQNRLHRFVGWLVIESVGARGYEQLLDVTSQQLPRHTKPYMDGIHTLDSTLKSLDPAAAEACMLQNIRDNNLRAQILRDIRADKPLTQQEIDTVPLLPVTAPKPRWYIGSQDAVDTSQLSEAVAREIFEVEPIRNDWDHIPALSSTEEVVAEISSVIEDFKKDYFLRFNAFPKDPDNRDSVPYMFIRRQLSREHSMDFFDFNDAGLQVGQQVLGRPLTEADSIVDIGSSTGRFIAEAADSLGVNSTIVCIDPDEMAERLHRLTVKSKYPRTRFIRAIGEAIPLASDSMQIASSHNQLFRATDPVAQLHEMSRVVVSGGVIVVSSNIEGHAHKRHYHERQVAETVNALIPAAYRFAVPRPPAEGMYIENLPALLKQVGQLATAEYRYIPNESETVIRPGRSYEDYLDAIAFSATNTNLHPKYRKLWRAVVEELVRPQVEADIERSGAFTDNINRGMYVIKNNKPA